MIGFPLGLVASNASEWLIHKHVLHGLGKQKGTFWSFHFHEHHKNVRKSGGYDKLYEGPVWGSSAKSKEAIGIAGLAIAITPLVAFAPWFVAGVWANSAAYYFLHRKAHLEPEWARRWLPWHVDHHMAPSQEANWCVTTPLWDHVMGTRKPWVGTEAEKATTEARRAALKRASAAVAAASPTAVVAPAVATPPEAATT